MPGVKAGCRDMKIRFCCVKSVRAQWGAWAAWSDCSRSCDGGLKERRRSCQQASKKQDILNYNPLCVGEESEHTKLQLSLQRVICSVQGCPQNYKWTPWSVWSSCGQSCGEGNKERLRSCRPAANGGEACPDKKKNPDLYHQAESTSLIYIETLVGSFPCKKCLM